MAGSPPRFFTNLETGAWGHSTTLDSKNAAASFGSISNSMPYGLIAICPYIVRFHSECAWRSPQIHSISEVLSFRPCMTMALTMDAKKNNSQSEFSEKCELFSEKNTQSDCV